MLNLLTVPALVALISFPGFGLKKTHVTAPGDTLPPPWKSASRLALENDFVLGGLPSLRPPSRPGVRLTFDPRRLQVAMDPDSGTLSTAAEFGDVPLGASSRIPLRDYSRDLTRRNLERQWRERARSNINSLGAMTPQQHTQGLQFQLPSPLPRRVQSWLGPGGPAINVSGSENIRLSGTSNWTNRQSTLLGQRKSLFPSLDMQQDLDIRLEGQLSDRIKVNLLQNSANQIPLANRIAINYRGEEDDLVQSLDLGNTNLSLPGTQFVSYSGKNEGLFGAKLATRVGPLDWTVLASKQEGRSERASAGGGASSNRQTLLDVEWVHGQYFMLYDPNLSPTLDIPDTSIHVYVDDANAYNNATGTVDARAYVDPLGLDGDPSDTTNVLGVFEFKTSGALNDFEILQNIYGPWYKVIRLKQPLSGDQCLAVTYSARYAGSSGPYDLQVGGGTDPDGRLRLKLLRTPARFYAAEPGKDVNVAYYDATRKVDRVRELELKNVYPLGGSGIDPKTFRLSIRKGTTDPPVVSYKLGDNTVPYVEVIGLDNLDETGGTPVRGHDGQVDGTALRDANNIALQTFIDYDRGLLILREPRPFAPRLAGAGAKRFDQLVSSTLFRRDSLVGATGSNNEANPAAYDKYTVLRGQDAVYYMDVEYTAARAGGELSLGRGNLIEGSEVVTVNGQVWQRDRDYRIDYDLGKVTLIKQLGPTDNLNVDYSYAPLFQQAGRTLLGSAFRLEGRDRALGGAFMYESRGAQDLRPRLGEEPSRSVIGDLNTDWTLRPTFLTRLADRLPGVRTTTASEMRMQAEVGMSFPNPNTRNEVFIDDMEGVRDAVSLSMGAERWKSGSVPSRLSSGVARKMTDTTIFLRQRNAEVHWFAPPAAVKEWMLKPTLTQAQGADNSRQALAISVPRRPRTARNPDEFPATWDSLWTSMTYPLDPYGIDVSRAQFIEMWVNDFNDEHGRYRVPRVRGRHVKLHIDIGKVSEDQMRSPDRAPNDTLDTEDANLDGQLTVTDSNNEDTGLDGRVSPRLFKGGKQRVEDGPVLDLSTAGPDDPTGDDFRGTDGSFPDELDPRRYRFTNGTEDNKNLNPNPDTEDLNNNGILDTDEAYFEYTIDLGDEASPYLVTDVLRDYDGKPTYRPLTSDNGWRRYRIPISDSLRVAFGLPDLTHAQHVRVWLEGIVNPDPDPEFTDSLAVVKDGTAVHPLIVLGSLDIVGSRWLAADLPARMDSLGTTSTLNSVNTVDNADVYVPPFDPGQTRNGNQGLQRREQSLSLEFTELAPGDTLEAYKTFSVDENYSRYGKLDWFVAGYDIPSYDPAADTLWYFVRFASDETGRNYYEYRARVPRSSAAGSIDWSRVSLQLTALSNLKLDLAFPKVDPILYRVPGPDGSEYVIKGRPSFTRLRRISFGLINGSGVTARRFARGQLWFDELRATDVARDVGRAQRVTLGGNIANLLQYNAAWSGRDADFLSVGETRGTGSSQDQLNLGGTVQLQRFFEGTGIVMPFTYGYARSSLKPRFSAGDDVVRTGALEDASETRSETRSWSTSYQRVWSERSNPLLRYTIGGITANLSRTRAESRNPTNVDARRTSSAGVNWNIAPRNAWVFGLPFTKSKVHPLPERVYWNYAVSTSEGSTFDRLRDSTNSLLLRNVTRGRTAGIDFGADTRPIDMFHHFFKATRNLTLDEPLREKLGFINLGRVVNWSQGMDAAYTLQRGAWLRPRLSWSTGYQQDNGPELSKDLSVRRVGNSQNMRVSWDLPFDRLARRTTPTAPPPPPTAKPDTAAGAAKPAKPPRPPRDLSLGTFLGRLGTITTDASVTQSSSYSRLIGTPSLAYLMGLTSDPGLGSDSSSAVRALFGNTTTKIVNWSTSARSRIDVGFGASLSSRGELNSRRGEMNGVLTRSTSARFPDFEVDYGRVPALLRLDKFMLNPRLRTSYSQSRTNEYQNESRTGRNTQTEWRPLIGINGDFKNGTRAELRIERRGSRRESFSLGRSVTTESNTDLNLNVNRSYSQGQKVNVLGKETTVRTSITLGFSGAYSLQESETRRAGFAAAVFPTKKGRVSARATGSYGFSSNVTGNAALGYLQTNDFQLGSVTRSITVELRAQFTF